MRHLSLVLALAACAESPAATEPPDAGTDLADTLAGNQDIFDTAVAPVDLRECAAASDCAGQFGALGPCETAACNYDSGRCVRLAASDGTACTDRDPCTEGDRCLRGRCEAGGPVDCDDANPCTLDRCERGCLNDPLDGASCDDGQACTERDRCERGRCQGRTRSCDDDDPCTADTCDRPTGACVFTPIADCP